MGEKTKEIERDGFRIGVIILIITLLLSLFIKATEREIIYCAHFTEQKDTLFLLENDSIADLLYEAWLKDTTWRGDNPTIKFIPLEELKCLKSK